MDQRKTVPRLTRASSQYRRASVALFLAGFATFSLLYCVQPLLPVFARDFGVSPASSSLPLSCSTFALAVAIVLAAILSERAGRRELMFASLLASSLLNIACAAAPTWSFLLGLRLLEGFTLGGVPAVAMTWLAEEVEPAELGLAMGLYVAGTAFGGMVGRVGAGVLAEHYGWRGALGSVGLLDVAAAAGFVRLLPLSQHFAPRRNLGAAYHLKAWRGHMGTAELRTIYSIGALVMGCFMAIFNYAGYRLMRPPYGFTQTQQGYLFLVYVFGIGASSFAGFLVDRMGRGKVLVAGIVTMTLGVLLSVFAQIGFIVAGVALVTIGFFAAHAVASSWVGRLARTDRGHATSLYLLSYYLGGTIAGTMGGWFWSHDGWNGVAGFSLLLMAAALGAAGWMLSREKQTMSLAPEAAE
ncbi:MFS transporter [Acetobacter estunensis]|uniref:MFS transporter n=1 Tax=Acetobacter estunensis TaxID=104097 RepID=UPI001C2D28F3|nr:MFS transporter [Acetobacter estunensis]